MKTYLRVDDDSFDGLISGLIMAARLYCENFQGRAYLTQTWDLTLDNYPDANVNRILSWQMERVFNFPYSFNRLPGSTRPLIIPRPPLQAVSFVKFTDSNGAVTTYDPNKFVVDVDHEPGRVALVSGESWPNLELQPIAGVRIRYVAGYGDNPSDVPQNIRQAIMLWAAHRFDNPSADSVPEAVHALLWQDRMADLS